MTAALEGGEWLAARSGRTLPPGKTRYSLYRRLGGPQGRSGQARKISPPTGFDPRTVQPVVSRYTDWATRPTCRDIVHIYCNRIYLFQKTAQLYVVSKHTHITVITIIPSWGRHYNLYPNYFHNILSIRAKIVTILNASWFLTTIHDSRGNSLQFVRHLIVGNFRCFHKIAKSDYQLQHVGLCLSVHTSAWKNSASNGASFREILCWRLFRKTVEKISF
jgi:hypothetical protein